MTLGPAPPKKWYLGRGSNLLPRVLNEGSRVHDYCTTRDNKQNSTKLNGPKLDTKSIDEFKSNSNSKEPEAK